METFEDNESSSSNIIPALIRYRYHLAVAIPVLLLIGIGYVLLIPPVYRSTGFVMVETQQIPTSLVQTTVTSAATEQIDVITQRVMTRDNLMEILGKNSYFKFDELDDDQKSALLNQFRNSVEVEITSARSGRSKVAIGFSVSYESDSPGVAAKMTNELVRLYLAENVKTRTQRASETTDFLESEAEKMRIELEKTEQELAEFKRKNKDALPEHLNLYTSMREEARRNFNDINEKIATTENQIKLLKGQLAIASSGSPVSASSQNLSALKEQYRTLSLQYQPDHPDLVLLKDKIKALETGKLDEQEAMYQSDQQREVKGQLTELETRLQFLSRERELAQTKLSDLDQRIINIPQVERGLTVINRNYQTALEQYRSLQKKVQSASVAESLEQEQKSERFILLEEPLIPTSPYKPDRKKLFVMAVAGSFGLPLVLVGMIGFFDNTVRTRDALSGVIGSPPLIEIPNIDTEADIETRKKMMVQSLVALAVILLVSIALIHLLVMPVDELIEKVVQRFGE